MQDNAGSKTTGYWLPIWFFEKNKTRCVSFAAALLPRPDFLLKNDGFHTKDDGFHTKNDGF